MAARGRYRFDHHGRRERAEQYPSAAGVPGPAARAQADPDATGSVTPGPRAAATRNDRFRIRRHRMRERSQRFSTRFLSLVVPALLAAGCAASHKSATVTPSQNAGTVSPEREAAARAEA